jgi:hypothetical protein
VCIHFDGCIGELMQAYRMHRMPIMLILFWVIEAKPQLTYFLGAKVLAVPLCGASAKTPLIGSRGNC